jgi:hypothetical protein
MSDSEDLKTMKQRVAKAFLAFMHANDTGLTQDQIRAIQIICSNYEFGDAVRAYLNTIYPVQSVKPTSSDTPQI